MRTLLSKPYLILLSISFVLFLCIYFSVIYYHTHKPLPEATSMEGPVHYLSDEQVHFLYDLTYEDGANTVVEQEIFETVFKVIEEAKEFVVMDFFLYNNYYDADMEFPSLSARLTNSLIEKKKQHPEMEIVLITDEINTSYGSHLNEQFEQMKAHGITILMTDVDPLRDSTPLYSGVWRMFFQWFGQKGNGSLPNLMADQAPPMTFRSYLKLLNVKANHRKTVVTDQTSLILSGNPHDASAYHSNIGFQIDGAMTEDVLKSEQAAANLAGGYSLPTYESTENEQGDTSVQLITEEKVKHKVIESIRMTEKDDEIWMAMFYLAERDVIDELLAADERGVKIMLILDPNENAFGSKKSGLPNRPVAKELHEKSTGNIEIRWYNTGEEQYHPKLLYVKTQEEHVIIGGSTNFTKRNMDDLNLETNVAIVAAPDSPLSQEIDSYFLRQWTNKDGSFTLHYEAYQSELTTFQRLIYTFQEWLNFTTF